jgi:tetratricopeptide (TPR) repeat protein
MGLAAAILTVLAATLSRGAWIALAASGAAWFLVDLIARRSARSSPTDKSASMSRRLLPAVLWVLLLLAGAFFLARSPVGPNLLGRLREIGSLKAPTTLTRLEIWGAGLRMAASRPVLGVGTDAFAVTFPPYRTTALEMLESGGSPPKAHNEAIEILATQGILGAVAAFLVVLFAARAVWRTLRHREPALRLAAVAAGAALVGFVVQDLASFSVVALGTLAAALAGWLSAAAASGPTQGVRVPASEPAQIAGVPQTRARARPGWALAIACLLAAVAFVPLVLNPWRAEMAMKAALHSQAGSPFRDQALTRGTALAPWDARFENLFGWSLLGRAQAMREMGQRRALLQRARNYAARAIRIEPRNGDHHVLLAAVLAEQTALEPPVATIPEVRAALANAVKRDPNNSAIMDQAANLWLRLGQGFEARSIAYRHAVLLPNMAPPMGTLGYLALQQDRWADAADTLRLALVREWRGEKSVTSKAQATTWSNLSVACIWLKRFEEARTAAEKALMLDPALVAAEKNRSLAMERLAKTAPRQQ